MIHISTFSPVAMAPVMLMLELVAANLAINPVLAESGMGCDEERDTIGTDVSSLLQNDLHVHNWEKSNSRIGVKSSNENTGRITLASMLMKDRSAIVKLASSFMATRWGWLENFREGAGFIWALLLAAIFCALLLLWRSSVRSARNFDEGEATDESGRLGELVQDGDPWVTNKCTRILLILFCICLFLGAIIVVALCTGFVNALIRFGAHGLAFFAATAVVLLVDLSVRKVYRSGHNSSPPNAVAPFQNEAAISNTHVEWRPQMVNLGKDLALTISALWLLQPILNRSVWLVLVAASMFLLQRCSGAGENKRRFVLALGCPIAGFGMMCYGAVASLDTLRIGIAVLWGSFLETVSKIVLLCQPQWCTHFAYEAATMNFKEQLKTIRTGDILLISGYERTSTNQRFFSNGDWSHVAMFLTSPPQALKEKLAASRDKKSESRVWVLESDPENADLVRGEKVGHSDGVQLVPAEAYFESLAEYYRNRHVCVVRHLIIAEEKRRNQIGQSPMIPDDADAAWNKNYPKLADWLLRRPPLHGDAPCESGGAWDLVWSAMKWNKEGTEEGTQGTGESTKELLCSELVARCYVQMELLSENVSPENYAPGDFSSLAPFNLNLHRQAGLTLEQSIVAPARR